MLAIVVKINWYAVNSGFYNTRNVLNVICEQINKYSVSVASAPQIRGNL